MKKTICVFLSALMLLGSVSVMGAPIDKISVDYDNQCVTLQGSGFQKNESVIVEVADYNLADKRDGIVIGIPDEAVNYIGASAADENGSVDFVFSMKYSSETGSKLLKISSVYGTNGYDNFYFYSDEKVNSVLKLFREAVEEDDEVKLKSVLNDAEAIDIIFNSKKTVKVYNGLKNSFVESDALINILNAQPPKRISDVTAVLAGVFIPYAAINTDSADDLKYIVSEYPDALGINDEIYQNVYNTMTDANKAIAASMVIKAKNKSGTLSDWKKVFFEKTLITAVRHADNHTKIYPLITTYYNSYFGLDTAAYTSLSNRYPVDSGLMDGPDNFETYEQFIVVFNNLVDASKSQTGAAGSGIGGGGGSPGINIDKGYVSGHTTISDYYDGTDNAKIPSAEEKYFNDLTGYEWAEDAVLTLYYMGIVNGIAEGVYAPSRYVTRAEFAKLLTTALSLVDDENKCTFSDVPSDSWSYKYIASAYANGIAGGTSEYTFEPNGLISREQMAVMCCNAMKTYKKDIFNTEEEFAEPGFADSDSIEPYAFYSISILSKKGIILGQGNNYFAPKSGSTRAEAAVIIMRMLNALNIK